MKRKSNKPTKELTDTKKTTRIRKRFGPFKVAFRTFIRTWIECLVVGNIFQKIIPFKGMIFWKHSKANPIAQVNGILSIFPPLEMGRVLKDFLRKDDVCKLTGNTEFLQKRTLEGFHYFS